MESTLKNQRFLDLIKCVQAVPVLQNLMLKYDKFYYYAMCTEQLIYLLSLAP